MKKITILSTLCFLLLTLVLNAQTPPNAFNYSAVARNAAGLPIATTTIGIQITILKTSTTGVSQYSENHFVNTDAFGLFNLVIGAGAVQSGSMATIDWSNDNYYLKVGMDGTGGTNFLTMGTTQLLSVPYALYAKSAGSVTGGTNSDNQQLSVSTIGDTLFLQNGGFVIIPGISAANLGSGIVSNPGAGVSFNGYTYTSIVLGNGQEWMAENLRTIVYANGDPIPNVTAPNQWSNLSSGAWIHYNNDSQYENPYGKLYNWYAVVDPRNVCPTGWHVPSLNEWISLTNYLGGLAIAGGKMKSTGTQFWQSPNTDATNLIGFSGLPGGTLFAQSNFGFIGSDGVWWTSTAFDLSNSWAIGLYFNQSLVNNAYDYKQRGMSIRCLKN